jgi:putative membrane protein
VLCGVALAQAPNPPQQQQAPTGPVGAPSTASPGAGSYPTGGPTETNSGSDMMFSDKSFVKQAADLSVREVELAKLAHEKSSSDAVKQFSQKIIDDHSRTDQSLQSAAAKVNVEVPTDQSKGIKKAKDKLAKLSGDEFDHAYAKAMLSDEKDSANIFNQEASMGRIPEAKEFATKTLPVVESHRKMAQELAANTNNHK